MFLMEISLTAPCCTPIQAAPLSETDAEERRYVDALTIRT